MKLIISVIVMAVVACSVEARLKAGLSNGTATLEVALPVIFGKCRPRTTVDVGIVYDFNWLCDDTDNGGGPGFLLTILKFLGSGRKGSYNGGVSVNVSGNVSGPQGNYGGGSGGRLISGLLKFLGSGQRGLVGGVMDLLDSPEGDYGAGVNVSGGVYGNANSGLITGLMKLFKSESGPLAGLMKLFKSEGGPFAVIMKLLRSESGPLAGLMNLFKSEGGPFAVIMKLLRSESGPFAEIMKLFKSEGGLAGILKLFKSESGPFAVIMKLLRSESGPFAEIMKLFKSEGGLGGIFKLLKSESGPFAEIMKILRSEGGGYNGTMGLSGTLNGMTSGLFRQILDLLNKVLNPVFTALSKVSSDLISPQLLYKLTSGALGSPNGTMSGGSIPGVHIRFDARIGDKQVASFKVGAGRRQYMTSSTDSSTDDPDK